MSDVKKLAKFLTSKGKDISIFVEGDGKYTVASIAPGAAPKAEPSALSAEEQAWEDKFK
ncbi:hypothetical protein [Rhizobium sp. AC44/96]|uniref:hypothetical protein n=1 Tax=Rhizobium sp. AC44/96 TaxID=1841654 RepID=UPI0013018268|nr:hypothetical protein [Rhizobium sp. AC44/96]